MSECYPRALLSHGKDYERDSLRVMVTAVDRHFLEMEYQSRLIVRDREFQSLKQVLEGKARLLKQQGKAISLTSEP